MTSKSTKEDWYSSIKACVVMFFLLYVPLCTVGWSAHIEHYSIFSCSFSVFILVILSYILGLMNKASLDKL